MSKTVLITGASRGIGAEMVRQFAKNGYRVAFTYLASEEKAAALSAETGALAIRCDARSEAETKEMADQVMKAFHHLDVLICNAGTSHTGLLQDMTVSEWDDLFALHVRGAFLAARAFLPGMISERSGSILFISSMWGQVGASCEVHYSASKAAMIGFTQALAKEVGPSGVRVNCIAPGVIQTDMNAHLDTETMSALCEETPLMRIGAPEEVARTALFLCSEGASFITGQVLGVNGGFII